MKIVKTASRNFQKAILVLKHEGLKTVVFKTHRYLKKKVFKDSQVVFITKEKYQEWLKTDLAKRSKNLKTLEKSPKISIIFPVYNTQISDLKKAIDSVLSQKYSNWELCIADDASTDPEIKKTLQEYIKKDERIKCIFREKNDHISESSNTALELATGEYIALFDHDDYLFDDALYYVADAVNQNPDADFFYSDEDQVTVDDEHLNPYFKSDWSRFHTECTMYTNHFAIYKAERILSVKGWRKGLEGSQDLDLLLRVITSKKDLNVVHIPKILYSWRLAPTSASVSIYLKPYAITAQRKAITDYMSDNKIEGEVISTSVPGIYRIKRKIIGNPKISVIIPTKDNAEMLKDAVESVQKNKYSNYEIIIVNNLSSEEKTLNYLKELAQDSKIKVIEYPQKFNYSKINNLAARVSTGDYLLFLNNDVKSIDDDWIESMLELAQLEEVGAVGAKLIFRNNTIQHAGIVYGVDPGINHVMAKVPVDSHGYGYYLDVIRDYSAVTAACMLCKKKDFDKVNGFDEDEGLINQDIDLCFKLKSLGKSILFTPYAKLYHYESVTRNDQPVDKEWIQNNKHFLEKWSDKLSKTDPFYNPNLSKNKAYSLD